jgi:Ricin-type beta-trefoil lectin domain
MAAATAVLATVVAGQPAQANNPGPIVNQHSGKCLQPVPDSYPGHVVDIYTNGIPVEQVACNGSTEQLWTPVYLFTGTNPFQQNGFGDPVLPLVDYYYVINYRTQKCMDFTNANSANGTRVQQWDCNGGNSEKWTPYWVNGAFQKYVNNATHKCLDVPNQTTDQVIMQEWGCFDGTDNVAQMFTFPQ